MTRSLPILLLAACATIATAQPFPVAAGAAEAIRSDALRVMERDARGGTSVDDGVHEPRLRVTRSDRAWSTTGAVASFGSGMFATFRSPLGGNWFTQWRTGGMALRPGHSALEGGNAVVSMIPVMAGVRYDLARSRGRAAEWSLWTAAGAGPVLGFDLPVDAGFFGGLSRLGIRAGAGAYAAVGTELRVAAGWAGMLQLEYDAVGFTAPLAGRRSYQGPSFSFGIEFALR